VKIIIITGGIGAGKSVVCKEFERLGAFVIGGDKVGHDCLKPDGLAYADVVAEFGEEILNDNKTINRGKLAELAFASRERLNRLNELTHKHILTEIAETVDKIAEECHTKSRDNNLAENESVVCDKRRFASDIIVLEIPLFRAADIRRDAVISVVADDEQRIERVMKRSKISREFVERIMSLQPTVEDYRDGADICIENVGTLDELREKAKEIFHFIENCLFPIK